MPRALPFPGTSAGASPSRPSGSSSSSGARCRQSPWWSCPPGLAQTCRDCENKELFLLLYSLPCSPSRAAALAVPAASNQKFMSALYWAWAFLRCNLQPLYSWQDTSVQIWQGFLLSLENTAHLELLQAAFSIHYRSVCNQNNRDSQSGFCTSPPSWQLPTCPSLAPSS